jgi:hypothetical protein
MQYKKYESRPLARILDPQVTSHETQEYRAVGCVFAGV